MNENKKEAADQARRGGSARGKSWPAPKLNITARLGLVKFIPDEKSHLSVIDPEVCKTRCPQKFCTHTCPAQVYRWEDEEKLISIAFEGCLECGTCRSGGCPWENIEMSYPRGGYGVQYRLG
ncbi:MAG: 4Fe-4S dicluster domain-containing protein [Thermoleophilia bacterium]